MCIHKTIHLYSGLLYLSYRQYQHSVHLPGHHRVVEVGEVVGPGRERIGARDDVLLTDEQVERVVIVVEDVLEVVAQRVGVADLLAREVRVLRGGTRTVRVVDQVGRHAVEAVLRLAVGIQTGLDAQLEVLDDLPLEGGIGVPVRAAVAAVVVGRGDQRVDVVAGHRLVIVARSRRSEGEGAILDGVLHTAVTRSRTRVVVGVRTGTPHVRVGVTDREVEADLLRRLVVGLEVEVVSLEIRTDHDGALVDVGVTGRPLELVAAARDAQVVVEGRTRAAEGLVEPVDALHVLVEVHVRESAEVGIVVVLELALDHGGLVLVLYEFIGRHRGQRILVGELLDTVIDVVVDRDLAGLTALGRHDDNTVGTTGTVDGRREGILQHVDRGNVRSRDVGDALHGEAVDDVERRVVLRDRTAAADAS